MNNDFIIRSGMRGQASKLHPSWGKAHIPNFLSPSCFLLPAIKPVVSIPQQSIRGLVCYIYFLTATSQVNSRLGNLAMGLPISVLGKLGLPSLDSLTTDQVYNRIFQDVNNYADFHSKFIKLCSEFNTVMPGKHYVLKANADIKTFYDDWQKLDSNEQRKRLVDFLTDNVVEYKASSTAMMVTGLIAPGAAVLLKKSGQNLPQLKMFRLHLVPNAVFVPTATLLSLIGVRMFNISKAPAKLAANT